MQSENETTYAIVVEPGLGALDCLGFEVFGRWGRQAVDLLPRLAHCKAHGMHPRLRRSMALAYQHRWAGLISIGLMKAVVVAAQRGEGADLESTLLELEPGAADLEQVL